MGTKHGQGQKAECVVCGASFTKQGQRKTCGPECRDAHKAMRFPLLPEHKCESFHCTVILPPSKVSDYKKYCSEECRRHPKKVDFELYTISSDDYIWVKGDRVSDHPGANSWGMVRHHVYVAYDKYGPGPHPCHWCGYAVDWFFGERSGDRETKKIHVDHLNWVRIDNRSDNLVIACNSCNANRSLYLPERGKMAVAVNNGPGSCSSCNRKFKSRMAYTGHTPYGCKGSKFMAI